MGGFAQKPGGSTLVQPQGTGGFDVAHPGKRTLTEQVHPVVQRATARGTTTPQSATPHIASPEPGIDKSGFVDNSNGAPLYNRPAESNGQIIRDNPLPPAARVFVSGTHPTLKHWWYVTAYLEQEITRGYIEDFRVNTALPEPFAELRQLVGGETAEGLAKEKFGSAVTDGHDLRYYENVLLYVNHGRDGIVGKYQDPNVLGDGANNIKLVAGHRIWLVSADYAKALESVVPSGSLTGGAVAKVKRFAGHVEDILRSVTEARHYFAEVAGEFAQAIRDHLTEVIGITAGFLAAESLSMLLAVQPTGVSQILAALIQLALSAFGAAGMVQAGVEALQHGAAWLTGAWTAKGDPKVLANASREFVRMLVAIAVAALSYLGAKSNYGNALKIANRIPTGGVLVPATAGAAGGNGQAVGAVAADPGVGAFGAGANATLRLTDREKAALGEGPDVDDLSEKNVDDARSRERHDRRAADGPSKQGGVRAFKRTRTPLAQHIPPRGPAFADWFDSLTLAELDRLLADESVGGKIGAREVIAENIRHPGGEHEWLMVAEVRQFKKWGVSMKVIQEGRTFTDAAIGKRFRHGSAGSGTMHETLRNMIRSSGTYDDFLNKLNEWADRELVESHSRRWPDAAPKGRYSLPDTLQLRSNG